MDAVTSIASSEALQSAITLVNAALQLAAYLWLPAACVKDKAEYDYVVVGAGTAGAVIARRLAENTTLRILLIEAGGDPTFESILPGLSSYVKRSKVVYNYTSETDDYSLQCHQNNNFVLSAGKMLGGTSSANYLSYERGTVEDYDRWAAAAKDSAWEWPKLLKYFKKSENLQDETIQNSPDRVYHSFKGPLIITRENRSETNDYLKAFAEIGNDIVLDLNSKTSIGYTNAMYTLGGGRRQSTAFAFLAQKKDIQNLDILKDTEVTKILFDKNKNAVGVTALTKDNEVLTLKAKREVIVCAGTMNSPKLLMLSGIGPKKHLESKNIPVLSDLPVGENYHDHISTMVFHKIGKGCKPLRPLDNHIFPYPLILGYVALNKSNNYPDYVTSNYIISGDRVANFILRSCAFVQRLDYDICNTLYKELKGQKLVHTYLRTSQPQSRGKLLLRSTNPKDQMIIETRFFSNNNDLNKQAQYLKHFMNIGQTKYFRSLGAEVVDPMKTKCGEYSYGSMDYWRCYALCMVIPAGHVCGTCALGSVVDSKLRVIGVQKLRVADASIIPTITASGTNAPTIMIGEKAADLILGDIQ